MSGERFPGPYALWPVVLAGVAATSTASIFIRLADAPPIATAAYRVALAALIICPWAVLKKRERRVHPGSDLRLLLLSGSFLALHFIFWITGLSLTSVASAVTLVNTTPLFTLLYSILFLGEKPGARLWLGIALAMAGSAIVTGIDFSIARSELAGDLLAVLGAVMAAGYLSCGRVLRIRLDLSAYVFGTYGAAAVLLIALSFAAGVPLRGFSPNTYFFLVMLALVPQLIGHTAFNWALRFLPPGVVAVLILGEPAGASLLAWLFLGESVSLQKAAGLLLLGAGIVFGSAPAIRAADKVPEGPV